ncbi:tyrosine-type recombinase/integrase [Romboutsia sp. Marseille-P6047]|uniref:tyrosine-type recombinase/integrase n=1 Tax=Romboutsia sp. Marseille-P6047 TaxID=2161817 RepID=UPI000F06CD3B|nr:tyrosine-type recombinase/integrase [Romboutsia sp. Marseille-P6047]
MKKVKRPSRPIKDIKRVFDIQDYLRYKSERNYILFILGITTGYRAGDLVELKVRDVKEALRRGKFEIMEGKKKNSKNIRERNRKPRSAEILPEVEKELKRYIKNKKDYEYMFPSRKGKSHIKVDRVTAVLKEAAEYFDMDDITAHSMRKTYAYTVYMENGCDIIAVKEMLGHSSIEETKLYLGLDNDKYHQYSQALRRLIR